MPCCAARCSACNAGLSGQVSYKPRVGVCSGCCSEHRPTALTGVARAMEASWTRQRDPTGGSMRTVFATSCTGSCVLPALSRPSLHRACQLGPAARVFNVSLVVHHVRSFTTVPACAAISQDTCCKCAQLLKTDGGWSLSYKLCEDCFISPRSEVAQTWSRMLVNFGNGAPQIAFRCHASALISHRSASPSSDATACRGPATPHSAP